MGTMKGRFPSRPAGAVASGIFLFLFLFPLMGTTPCLAGGVSPGYTDAVRTQADRVVASAGPGREEALAKEVRLLRKRMRTQGVLSINAVPDLIFERAVREGWKDRASGNLRVVTEVAPFSVPMWAWLVKEDLFRLRVAELIHDVDGLSGSVRRFGPALIGYAAWLISYLSALGCWFVAWAAFALFLRARPALEADLLRILKLPYRDYVAPVATFLLFLLPVVAGLGLAVVACIWLLVAAGYLRRGELVMVTAALVFLSGLFLGGEVLGSLGKVEGDSRRGGWLGGEGYFPEVWPEIPATPDPGGAASHVSWMIRFAKARAEMQGGRPAAAETFWTELIREGKVLPEALNNRGIVLFQQGKVREGVADFEAALRARPGDAPALWNAYQAYLQQFNLDLARKLQPEAWDRIQKLAPFDFRPAEMDQGEWVASPLPVGEVWKTLLRFRGEWVREAGTSSMFHLFFHPLPLEGAIAFLVCAWLAAAIWKLLSLKFWLHSTCRVCGTQALIVGSREESDVCTGCRAQIGDGIRSGPERDRRVQTIGLHRRYVTVCALLVPGSGALWAGKDFRAMLYALVLSAALACVSVSLGGSRGSQAIITELQGTVAIWAAGAAAVLWLAGAAWGMQSFFQMQWRHGISGKKR